MKTNKFVNKMMKFMYGRNGFDYANKCLSWGYIFALSISFIFSLFSDNEIMAILSYAFIAISLVIAIGILFRFLSKDLPQRKLENEYCYRFKDKRTKAIALRKTKKKDKDHVYKKCPKCGKVLRFKRIKGKKTINCPHCNAEVTVHIHRNAKEGA